MKAETLWFQLVPYTEPPDGPADPSGIFRSTP
jgi:hypothetical protein